MKKSLLLLFFFLYGIHALFAQQLKINNGSTSVNKPDKYAVVIGISDYQNKDIPDLRFAHKDAEAFVAYLRSPSGGNLQNNQLKVLLNENATTAQIAAALEWLVEVGKEGDQAIIYFSGHGDVETKTMFQLGYLLTWDSPPKTYVAGAFPLSYLQAIVSTLALQNKTEVTLITDACRAGKLAGTAVGGAQITNANLSKQFANEVKILSCQPDEFSIEGEQWGGGRGAFSYHLIDGLYGLADENEDLQVNLFEIGRYLEDKVSKETDPHSQFPMILGSKNTLMASVDEQILLQLKEKRKRETPVLATIESKGFEEMSLAGVDSVWQQKYQDFIAALETGHLLDAPNEQPSAYELYLELSTINELKALHGTMQRNLASALQDEAQQTINAYLAANPAEMKKRYDAETDYGRYPRYLQKAAELLGEQNFYYPFIMAKLLYFEGLQLRLAVENNTNEKATYQQAIDKQLEALEYQEFAPFVLNELGVLHTRLFQDEKAFDYYKKAIALAPEWGLPYVNYCIGLVFTGQYDKALEYGEKALEYLPQFPQMYNFLAWVYTNDTEHLDIQFLDRYGLDLSDDYYLENINAKSLLQNRIRYQPAIDLLERASQIDSIYYPTFMNLALAYATIKVYDKAEESFKMAIELDSINGWAGDGWTHLILSDLLLEQGRLKEAERVIHKLIEISSDVFLIAQGYITLALIYELRGEIKKMTEAYEKGMELGPTVSWGYSGLGKYYFEEQEYQKAESLGLLMLINGNYLKLAEVDWLGNLYHQFNRPQDLEYICLKGLEFKPDYLAAMKVLIRHYHQTGQQQKVLEWIASKDPSVLIYAGYSAYLNKQYKEAEMYFQKAVQTGSDKQTAQQIGWKYHKHGEKELAEKYLRKALEINPEFHGPYWDLAWLYFSFGDYKKAIQVMDEGIEQFPDKFALKGIKAMIIALSETSGQVKEIFGQLERHRPGMTNIGTCLDLMREQNYEAVAKSRQDINEVMSDWWINRMFKLADVRMLAIKGDLDAAMDIIEKKDSWIFNYQLLQLDPALVELRKTDRFQKYMKRDFPEKYEDLDIKEAIYYPENCLLLAKYYIIQQEPDRAKFLFEKIIEIIPDTLSAESALILAKAYWQLGQLEKAKAVYPNRLDPKKPSEWLAAGKLFYLQRKKEQAAIYFEKYINSQEDKKNAYLDLGYWHYMHSENELAERYLKNVLEIDSTCLAAYRHLAWVYYSNDKKEQALVILDKGLKTKVRPIIYSDSYFIKAYIEYLSGDLTKSLTIFTRLHELTLYDFTIIIRKIMSNDLKGAIPIIEGFHYQMFPHEYWSFLLCQLKIEQGDMEAGMQLLEETLTYEGLSYDFLNEDPKLAPIREMPRYKELMGQYFPEKIK